MLLATYNSGEYLPELLKSILDNDYRNIRVVARDDGSRDDTFEVLCGFEKLDSRVTVLRDRTPSGGACQNFMKLLSMDLPGDYFMFADADDYWLSEKIRRSLEAVQLLEQQGDIPALAHCDLAVVDKDLRLIQRSFFAYEKLSPERADFKSVIFQNNVTGCACMVNRALKTLAEKAPKEGVIMHDWWCAMLSSAFGGTALIEDPLILYRQHGDNQVGAYNAGSAAAAAARLRDRKGTKALYEAMFRQAAVFLDTYRDILNPQQQRMLQRFSEMEHLGFFRRRLRIITDGFWKNTLTRNLGLMLVL